MKKIYDGNLSNCTQGGEYTSLQQRMCVNICKIDFLCTRKACTQSLSDTSTVLILSFDSVGAGVSSASDKTKVSIYFSN